MLPVWLNSNKCLLYTAMQRSLYLSNTEPSADSVQYLQMHQQEKMCWLQPEKPGVCGSKTSENLPQIVFCFFFLKLRLHI